MGRPINFDNLGPIELSKERLTENAIACFKAKFEAVTYTPHTHDMVVAFAGGLSVAQAAYELGLTNNAMSVRKFILNKQLGVATTAHAMREVIQAHALPSLLVGDEPLSPLSGIESDVLYLTSLGYKEPDIVEEVDITDLQFKNAEFELGQKLKAKSRPHFVVRGFETGELFHED